MPSGNGRNDVNNRARYDTCRWGRSTAVNVAAGGNEGTGLSASGTGSGGGGLPRLNSLGIWRPLLGLVRTLREFASNAEGGSCLSFFFSGESTFFLMLQNQRNFKTRIILWLYPCSSTPTRSTTTTAIASQKISSSLKFFTQLKSRQARSNTVGSTIGLCFFAQRGCL